MDPGDEPPARDPQLAQVVIPEPQAKPSSAVPQANPGAGPGKQHDDAPPQIPEDPEELGKQPPTGQKAPEGTKGLPGTQAKPAGKEVKKPIIDDWKTKLGVTKLQEKGQKDAGLAQFDFTYKFLDKMMKDPNLPATLPESEHPMRIFYSYLGDEPAPPQVQADKPLPSMAQPSMGPKPDQAGQQNDPNKPDSPADKKPDLRDGSQQPIDANSLGKSEPKLDDQNPAQPELGPKSSSHPGAVEHTTKPKLEVEKQVPAEKVKLPRFMKRIDLKYHLVSQSTDNADRKDQNTYLKGVTSIITSPNSKYAVVECDFYRSHIFVDLTQKGDAYVPDSTQKRDQALNDQTRMSPFNLLISHEAELSQTREEEAKHEYIEDDEKFGQLHHTKAHVQFFPDSSKIAVVEADRLTLRIYDTSIVAKHGWYHADACLKEVSLLELKIVRNTFDGPVTPVLGVSRNVLDIPPAKRTDREWVAITFMFFERLGTKTGYFDSLEIDTLIVGTVYGVFKVPFPKVGFFMKDNTPPVNQPPSSNKPELEKIGEVKTKTEPLKPQELVSRWLNLDVEKIRFERTKGLTLKNYEDYFEKKNLSEFRTFSNNSGTVGIIRNENRCTHVHPYKIAYGKSERQQEKEDEDVPDQAKNSAPTHGVLEARIKSMKFGSSNAVFPESVSANGFGMLYYDHKKGEILKTTGQNPETQLRLTKKTWIKSAIQKDDGRILLLVDEEGNGTLYLYLNKGYIIIDTVDMKIETFIGVKDDIVGISHYYASTQILDDHSAIVFANNGNLYVYNINLPLPNPRYFMYASLNDARPFEGSDSDCFTVHDQANVYLQGTNQKGQDLNKMNLIKQVNLDDPVKVKILPKNAFWRGNESGRLFTAARKAAVVVRGEQKEARDLMAAGQSQQPAGQDASKPGEANQELQPANKPEGSQPQTRIVKQSTYPIVVKTKYLDAILGQQSLVAVYPKGKPESKRADQSKLPGNSLGVFNEVEYREIWTQRFPGLSNLELLVFDGDEFAVALRDYSTSQPLEKVGAVKAPDIRWELFFSGLSSGGPFKLQGQEIGSFFAFNPSRKIVAFNVYDGRQRGTEIFTYLVEALTGRILFTLPTDLFSQVISEKEIIISYQPSNEVNDFSEERFKRQYQEYLPEEIFKKLEPLQKGKFNAMFVYNFYTGEIEDMFTDKIVELSQHPTGTEEQKQFIFHESLMLPIDLSQYQVETKAPETTPKPAAGKEQKAITQRVLMIKSNLISSISYGQDVVKDKFSQEVLQLWKDSSKKVRLNPYIQDGSVVFSRNNAWVAYYDESSMEAIRLVWTARPVHAVFQLNKVKQGEIESDEDTLRFNLKGIRALRIMFSDDNKKLIIRAGKKVTLFELYPPKVIFGSPTDSMRKSGLPQAKEVCDLELPEFAASSNIVSMKFRNGLLDLAYVKEKIFYFESVSFAYNPRNLYLKSIFNKLMKFSLATGKDIAKAANEIASLMMEQPVHQKFNDSTYLKILAVFKRTEPLREYLKQMSRAPHIIFQHSPYQEIVQYTNGGERSTNLFIECLIDFLQICVEKNSYLPIYDIEVLLAWLTEKEIESNKPPKIVEGKPVPEPDEQIKIDIKYRRKLLELITLAPVVTEIVGELKSPEENVAVVACKYSEQEQLSKVIHEAKSAIMSENSPNIVDYNSFMTAFPFNLSNGSKFSLDYFSWLEDVSDDDLVNKYSGIIYYKWSLVLKSAVVYSIMFWLLNGLLCAFMGFAYRTVWLGAIAIVVHSLFILYEIKCYIFSFKESIKDPWNYVDIVAHLFSLLSVGVIINYRDRIDQDPALFTQLSWLRMISFSIVTFRGLGLFRIFSGTRYLIVMIFAVFKEIAIFLSVFGYMIFIYWFVCLVRPSLVPDGQDETVYNSITQSLDIAFSNFSGSGLSWIVLVSTVFGQVILGLVLLNYLIAIVSKTHEKVSEQRSLYDVRMILSIIKEFDAFFYFNRKEDDPERNKFAQSYLTLIAKQEQSIRVKKLKEGILLNEQDQGTSKLMLDFESTKLKVERSLLLLERHLQLANIKLDKEVKNTLKIHSIDIDGGARSLEQIVDENTKDLRRVAEMVILEAESKGQRFAEAKAQQLYELQKKEEEAAKKKLEEQKKADVSRSSVAGRNKAAKQSYHEDLEEIDEDDSDEESHSSSADHDSMSVKNDRDKAASSEEED